MNARGDIPKAFRACEPANRFWNARMAWVNATPEQKLLGDGLEFVTGVTADRAIYRDGKTERLKLFLHCCYSVSRGRRAIGIHHNWNFRSTCKKSGGIT
jgi:hypothetical protein